MTCVRIFTRISGFLLPFEILSTEITSLDIGNFNTKCVRFPRYLTKSFQSGG